MYVIIYIKETVLKEVFFFDLFKLTFRFLHLDKVEKEGKI